VPQILLQAICADLAANLEAKLRRVRTLTADLDEYLRTCDPQQLADARRDLAIVRDLHQATGELLVAADAALTEGTENEERSEVDRSDSSASRP
jgi:hypothetical protein